MGEQQKIGTERCSEGDEEGDGSWGDDGME